MSPNPRAGSSRGCSQRASASGGRRPSEHAIGRQILAAFAGRLVLNTAIRFIYPFAAVISRGVGVPLTAVTSLIGLYQATALLGLVFSLVGDRLGYKLMMGLGLGLLSAGLLAGGLFPIYPVLVAALLLIGLSKSVFVPAIQAYVGEQVPFQRRGRIMGLFETSWAGSTLLGIPVIGLVIHEFGWRAPFFLLGGLGLISLLILIRLIPGRPAPTDSPLRTSGFFAGWQQLLTRKIGLGSLGFAFFMSMANDTLFVVYGPWLESSFQTTALGLGLGTAVIGAAELLGSMLTATLGDRFGLKRCTLAALILTGLGYAGLPFLAQSLSTAWFGMFIIFFAVEFCIVTFLSLCSEFMPRHRSTMLAGSLAFSGLGRMTGALIGGPVWLASGILGTGLVAAGISGLALISLTWALSAWQG